MSKKGPGREKLAASQARVQELLELQQDLMLAHELLRRSYQKQLNLIHQRLAKEPYYQSMAKTVVRAAAVRKAHDRGDKLVLTKHDTGAYGTATDTLAGTAAGGGPRTMQDAHQAIQRHQDDMRKQAAKVVELSKKLRRPKGQF
jgi:hypothetical protein